MELLEGSDLEKHLAELEPRLKRHEVPLGTAGEEEVRLPPYGVNVLLAGTSGSGGKCIRVVHVMSSSGNVGSNALHACRTSSDCSNGKKNAPA